MKEKKVLKLSLNKKTIAHLELEGMEVAKGGKPRLSEVEACEVTDPRIFGCNPTYCAEHTQCGCTLIYFGC
ncbi:MAG: hypothetical protein GY757_01760 [bacterium]|nr:hypothetical protein [bacterium]